MNLNDENWTQASLEKGDLFFLQIDYREFGHRIIKEKIRSRTKTLIFTVSGKRLIIRNLKKYSIFPTNVDTEQQYEKYLATKFNRKISIKLGRMNAIDFQNLPVNELKKIKAIVNKYIQV